MEVVDGINKIHTLGVGEGTDKERWSRKEGQDDQNQPPNTNNLK
jgi:hypothetical protein